MNAMPLKYGTLSVLAARSMNQSENSGEVQLEGVRVHSKRDGHGPSARDRVSLGQVDGLIVPCFARLFLVTTYLDDVV